MGADQQLAAAAAHPARRRGEQPERVGSPALVGSCGEGRAVGGERERAASRRPSCGSAHSSRCTRTAAGGTCWSARCRRRGSLARCGVRVCRPCPACAVAESRKPSPSGVVLVPLPKLWRRARGGRLELEAAVGVAPSPARKCGFSVSPFRDHTPELCQQAPRLRAVGDAARRRPSHTFPRGVPSSPAGLTEHSPSSLQAPSTRCS